MEFKVGDRVKWSGYKGSANADDGRHLSKIPAVIIRILTTSVELEFEGTHPAFMRNSRDENRLYSWIEMGQLTHMKLPQKDRVLWNSQ